MKQTIPVFLFGMLCMSYALADPADYIHLPKVDYGEVELGFKLGSIKPTGDDRESAAAFGIGYGFTRNWMAEIYVLYDRSEGGGTRLYSFEWENTFQLTPTGRYPVDLGFLTELERPRDRSEGYELTFGPLFQTMIGKVQINTNILFERQYRTENGGPMEIGYQFQGKYNGNPDFQLGIQGFGDIGRWDNWASKDRQSHRFGPAIIGKFSLGEDVDIQYDAAYLVETVGEQFSRTLRMELEYEF
jgi:outer membrane receptor protein involved in Fe transport